jgi:hypothetical protein
VDALTTPNNSTMEREVVDESTRQSVASLNGGSNRMLDAKQVIECSMKRLESKLLMLRRMH